jgi:hypothetical protein
MEGAVRGDNAQLFVEHQNNFARMLTMPLSECPRICERSDLFPDAG